MYHVQNAMAYNRSIQCDPVDCPLIVPVQEIEEKILLLLLVVDDDSSEDDLLLSMLAMVVRP